MAEAGKARALHLQALSRLLLLVAIPILVGLVMWRVALQAHRQGEVVDHAYRVQIALERLLSSLRKAEASQQGYLLSGEYEALSAYREAARVARDDAVGLAGLTSGSPGEQQLVAQIQPLVEKRLAELGSTIDLYAEGKLTRAEEKASIDRQRNLRSTFLPLVNELSGEEERLANAHAADLNAVNYWFSSWLIVGYGLIVLLVASLYYAVRRYSLQSADAEARLSALNAQLDERVRDRTSLLHDREQKLSELAGSLLTAHEEERQNLARELHDGVTQQLAFLSIELGRLVNELPATLKELRPRLQKLQDQTLRASSDLRSLTHGLHPSVIAELGLSAALEGFCTEFERMEGVSVDFATDVEDSGLSTSGATCLFRIAQESMRNAALHGRATRIDVSLTADNGFMQLRVADNGVGFSPDSTRGKKGLGLISMRERVRLANGSLTVKSEPGEGAEITARIPLAGDGHGENQSDDGS